MILNFDLFEGWSRPIMKDEVITATDRQTFSINYTEVDFPEYNLSIFVKDQDSRVVLHINLEGVYEPYNDIKTTRNKIEYVTTIDGIKCYSSPWCIIYGSEGDLTGVLIEDYEEECSANETFKKVYEAIQDKAD